MERIWSTQYQEAFEKAFREMKRDYHKAPFIYLTREDVIADLYMRLRSLNRPQEVCSNRFTIAKDGRWRAKKGTVPPVLMTPVHLMVGKDMYERGKVDLCMLDLTTMQAAVTSRYSTRRPTSLASWRFETGLGVSIVLNSSVQYTKRMSTGTGRASKTEGMKGLERDLSRVISDLKTFERSILLFVDHNALFTKNELEEAFSRRLDPYTQRLFYLSPRSGLHITGRRTDRSKKVS
jgi:hypothetical protein